MLPCAVGSGEEGSSSSSASGSSSFVWTSHALRVMERAVSVDLDLCMHALVWLDIHTHTRMDGSMHGTLRPPSSLPPPECLTPWPAKPSNHTIPPPTQKWLTK